MLSILREMRGRLLLRLGLECRVLLRRLCGWWEEELLASRLGGGSCSSCDFDSAHALLNLFPNIGLEETTQIKEGPLVAL